MWAQITFCTRCSFAEERMCDIHIKGPSHSQVGSEASCKSPTTSGKHCKKSLPCHAFRGDNGAMQLLTPGFVLVSLETNAPSLLALRIEFTQRTRNKATTSAHNPKRMNFLEKPRILQTTMGPRQQNLLSKVIVKHTVRAHVHTCTQGRNSF